MKKIVIYVLLFSGTYIFGQTREELIRVHNFSHINTLNAISNPFPGSIAYLANTNKIMYYNGLEWLEIEGSAGWNLDGNSGTNSNINFLGTTDYNPLNLRTNNTNRVRLEVNGNLSVFNDLVVDGAAYSNTAFDAGSSTNINFQLSNLAYTNANAQNTFVLQNLKDGGTYTLSVRGTSSGTASFTAAGFNFKSVTNGKTIANTHTLYTFLVIGNIVYVNMCSGL